MQKFIEQLEKLSGKKVILKEEYEGMKYYPESHLHPLVQQAIKNSFEDLSKHFPGITDIDCKYNDSNRKIYFTYRGKKYSFSLDLNGDTYTYVNRMVKRLIAPKPKTGRMITVGRKYY